MAPGASGASEAHAAVIEVERRFAVENGAEVRILAAGGTDVGTAVHHDVYYDTKDHDICMTDA